MIQSLLRKSVSLVPWRLRSAIKNIPIVAPFQRLVLKQFLQGDEFVHTVDAGPAKGLHYPIKLPEDKGIWTGTYEIGLATRIAAAVRRGEPCLDIGGWRGFFGGVMALAGASRVYIFEPLPANCAKIRQMIELNPRLPLELVEAAVSSETGTIEFCVMPESSMGKMATSSFQQDTRGEIIQVPAFSLDDWLRRQQHPPPVVIKVDVEGAEQLVLNGARQLLTAHKPSLFIEIHSFALRSRCREFLVNLGYRIRMLESAESEICHLIATR